MREAKRRQNLTLKNDLNVGKHVSLYLCDCVRVFAFEKAKNKLRHSSWPCPNRSSCSKTKRKIKNNKNKAEKEREKDKEEIEIKSQADVRAFYFYFSWQSLLARLLLSVSVFGIFWRKTSLALPRKMCYLCVPEIRIS